jgi:hypothetical protein
VRIVPEIAPSAVAEKLAHLEHDAWANSRKRPTPALLNKALRLLDEGGDNVPEPGDELPKSYRR